MICGRKDCKSVKIKQNPENTKFKVNLSFVEIGHVSSQSHVVSTCTFHC